ncbi:hypothetical protein F4824DRAFT_418728 [Ustulina deusta]|nr:hypothetical protein F4824DRAFT_418728 [Ustulina deusta]
MTWGIDMEKARKRWAHIRANMARNGLDKSPFVPRSFQEYIELKLKSTRLAAEEATKQLIQLEDHAENLCAGKPLDQPAGTLVIPKCLLDPAKNPSGLSPVLCRRSIWTGPVHSHGNTDWASRTELNEAGDKCIIEGRSRFFPVPRIDKLDGQSPQLALSEQEARELDEPTQELELSEIHYLTRELIERIRNMD